VAPIVGFPCSILMTILSGKIMLTHCDLTMENRQLHEFGCKVNYQCASYIVVGKEDTLLKLKRFQETGSSFPSIDFESSCSADMGEVTRLEEQSHSGTKIREACSVWYRFCLINASCYGIEIFNHDFNVYREDKYAIEWADGYVRWKDEKRFWITPQASFIVAGMFLGIPAILAVIHRYFQIQKKLKDQSCMEVTNFIAAIFGVIGNLCGFLLTLFPVNSVNTTHKLVTTIGGASQCVYFVMHLVLSWERLSAFWRGYFIAIVTLVLNCLVYWDMVAVDRVDEKGSIAEWIVLFCFYLHFVPFAVWTYQDSGANEVEKEKDKQVLVL